MKGLWMDFPFFFFVFFPFWKKIAAVFVTPLPPPSSLLPPPSAVCGSRNACVFPTELPQRTVPDVSETSPGLCWCTVGGGCSFCRTTSNHRLMDQSASEPQCELLSVPGRAPGGPFYLLSHVFGPCAPSRRVLITGSTAAPWLLPCDQL